MTFVELEPALRAKLEQLGSDAGSLWSESFREERGRDPEPEECDEHAETTAPRLARRARKVLMAEGIEADEALLGEVQQIIHAKFIEFSQDSP